MRTDTRGREPLRHVVNATIWSLMLNANGDVVAEISVPQLTQTSDGERGYTLILPKDMAQDLRVGNVLRVTFEATDEQSVAARDCGRTGSRTAAGAEDDCG